MNRLDTPKRWSGNCQQCGKNTSRTCRTWPPASPRNGSYRN
jgi:hypothetical protein